MPVLKQGVSVEGYRAGGQVGMASTMHLPSNDLYLWPWNC